VRVPLSPCFLGGNTASTIQDKYADRSRPLHSAVLTDQARDLAGAVTFTRSTPSCGTLAGHSLESAGFRSRKPKGYADSPSLNRPGALQKLERPGSVQLTGLKRHFSTGFRV
jgi:hypothetical protein